MITLTSPAAEQIRLSAQQGRMEGLPLRVAAVHNDDGSLHYGMGFDDVERKGDMHFTSQGIDVVISPMSMDLLRGTIIDYVELEPGQFQFIFMNPNDPGYRPPQEHAPP
ncbi:MAG: hypothetical protein KGI87_03825 [Burkholderiales bacterium]|nr:hypothetical protein [Burkholderiales bacterium]